MPVSDEMYERLMAYADGELPPAQVPAIEAALAADATLRDALRDLMRTRTLPRAAYDDILREPVPDHLLEALRAPLSNVTPMPPRASWRSRLAPRSGPAMALAAGLGLAAGVAFAMALNLPGMALRPADTRAAGLPAMGDLARVLETVASQQAVPGAAGEYLAATSTWPRRGGGWCRDYRIAAPNQTASAGIACRAVEGGWRIVAHHPWTPPAGSPADVVHAASGAAPREVDGVAEKLQGGNPRDPQQEAALIANGWSTR